MVGGKRSMHNVKANVKEFSKNALSATNRAISTTISTYSPFISASLMNASTAAFDVSRFAKENNPLTRNKNKDPYIRRAINRATDAFQTSLNELRQGHLSFEETRNEISEYINENSESEWDSMAASAGGEAGGAGGGSQKQFSVSDYVKGVAASSRSNVRALQVTTNKITESQYKSLNLATSKIVSSNMANMQAITRQFSVTNSRIENVNANLVNLVQFNNTTMSEFIGTATEHMGRMESYLEEMVAYARLDNEKRVNHYNGTGAKFRSRREEEESKDFLSYGFDPGKFAKSVIDNLMETAFGPTVLTGIASGIKGIFGKVPGILADYAAGSLGEFIQQFNPLQMAVEKFMPSLKGFRTVDDLIQKTITSFFTQLGSGTYDGPFSEIARLFGIKGSTSNIDRGDYNHDEAPWTGEDSRALKQVIPDYLATIEMKMANMVDQSVINTNAMIDAIRGVQAAVIATSNKRVNTRDIPIINGVQKSAVNSRRLYDYESGDFTNENKIIDRLRESLHRSTSMHYDESKQLIKELLEYADKSKLQNTSNRKALSDALTAIFMNFNAVDGETAINRNEEADLKKALQNLGIDISSGRAKDVYSQFKNTTNAQRLTVNRDVGHEFQYMRNLGLGAGTNDISTDIVNHNADVISSAKNVFTLESILRTLDDELDNFDAFKRTDAYKNMDRKTKQAYEQMSKERDRAYARQGIIAAILDPGALQTNPFNVVAATVVDSTTAVAASLSNVVSGVSTFSEELRNITDVIRETITNIKSFMIGGRPDLGGINGEGHDSGATNVSKDSVVKVHKGEIILDPTLSDRVRNGIADFINGDMSEKKFDKKIGKGLTESQVEEIKFIKQAMQSAGKLKIKKLDDVTDQIWDAAKYIDKAPTPEARLELLLRQIARNQEVGLLADNIGAIGESDRDEADMQSESRDRKIQALRHGVGKINKDGLFEGGILSDFANSVKGTYDKVVNSLVGRAYNTYEDDGQGGKKLVHHEKNDESFLNKYKNWLVKRAESAADALGIKGEQKDNISKTFNFLGENGHKLILGGLAGMVANVALPVAIGPVLGVGAALIGSSKTLNDRLFGTKDEETGMRADDGLISTKVTNFVKENMFSLISGGIAGMKIMKTGPVSALLGSGANKLVDGIIGILPGGGGLIGQVMQGAVGMAFGPVGGALLGMGVAAMTQSEHVKKFLFGEKDNETGKRSGGVIGDIKSAFTNLGDALKDKIFGKDVEYIDENGKVVKRKDGSGLLNRVESAVYAHMLRPITTSAKYIGKYFMLWFKDDVLNTSKRIVYPILTEVNLIADAVRNGLGDVIKGHVDSIKKAFEPVTKAISTVTTKLARATLGGVENIIKISLKSVSAPLKIAAGLLNVGKVGKPSLAAKLFMGDARGKVNRMMFGENVRLFMNEAFGKGDKQFIRLDNTMTDKKKNGVAKDGLKEKLEKYLEHNEKLFGKFKAIGDIFKAIGNTPFGTAIKTVLNVLTHPFSVILKNIAEGAMEGLKALVTAPFKLLGLPLKGIKWVGKKLFGEESKIGKAFTKFKERVEIQKSNGSVAGATSDLSRNFAKTFKVLNKSITKRTEQDGLLLPGQQQLVDAYEEHKQLKADKKALEKQHRKDKALDSYISKLNIKMSPAQFDALPAEERNKIIRKLVKKSGNKEIAKWDEEKLRALVTGGRAKVEKLDAKNREQDNATKNMANLPDTLKENTEKITDKLQEIYDALTGKKTKSEKPTASVNPPAIKNGAEAVTTAALPDLSEDVSHEMRSMIKGLPTDISQSSFGNAAQREAKAHEILNKMAEKFHIDLESLDRKDKDNLIKGLKTALKGGKDAKALNGVREKLIALAQKAAQEQTAADAQESVTEPTKTGIASRIKSWFEFDPEKDTKLMDASAKKRGKYMLDPKTGQLVVANKEKDSSGKMVNTGNYGLTLKGKFKKWVRDNRDGTSDAFNKDGSLNVDGMSWGQNIMAAGMLGLDWKKKKAKGELDKEKEEEMTTTLKMLSGKGKIKLMTDIVGKVIHGVAKFGTILVGLGLFADYIYPLIEDPLNDVLYGKDGNSGLLAGIKEFFVGKGDAAGDGATTFEKGGVFGLIKVGLCGKGADAGPDASTFEREGALGVVKNGIVTLFGDKLPKWIAKGGELFKNLLVLLTDAIRDGIDYYKEQEVVKKEQKDNNTAAMNTSKQIFEEAASGETVVRKLSNGEIITIAEDGNIDYGALHKYESDNKYTIEYNSSKDATDDYKIKRACAQFNIPVNSSGSMIHKGSRYFMLAKDLKSGFGLSGAQKTKMRSLTTSNGTSIDGYLFVRENFAFWELIPFYKKFRTLLTEGDEYAIFPACWDSNLDCWHLSKKPCGHCKTGIFHSGEEADTINTDTIDFTNGDEWTDSSYSSDVSLESAGSGSSIGYGHFTQNDPRWGRMRYSRLRNGGMSTMANGGCGPTAMANAVNNVYGRNVTNPLSVAKYASRNGYGVDGGTSAGLFSKGAKAFGVNSNAISKSGSSIANQIRHGKNVIVAGRGGSAYTSAGHIMSVRGIDRGGNAIVDDPMRRKSRHIPMNKLTRGMTHAWSIGRGDVSLDNYSKSNYSYLDNYVEGSDASSIDYADIPTEEFKQYIGGKGKKRVIPHNGIIWGYKDKEKGLCFAKALASAAFNIYAKYHRMDSDKQSITNFFKYLSENYYDSIIPDDIQKEAVTFDSGDKTKRYIEDTGYVNDAPGLLNLIYNSLLRTQTNSKHADKKIISMDYMRNTSVPYEQMRNELYTQLVNGLPIVAHTDDTTSKNFTKGFKASVFGYSGNSGTPRPSHAVLINGMIKFNDRTFALVADPGSGQGSAMRAQLRLIDFDQFMEPLKDNKLNHLITVSAGNWPSTSKYVAPEINDAESAMTGAQAEAMGVTPGSKASSAASKVSEKFTSFAEWMSNLVKTAAEVGSALLSAVFSGKSFRQIWYEMHKQDSNAVIPEQYAYDGSPVAEDQRKANAQEALARNSMIVPIYKNAHTGLEYINKTPYYFEYNNSMYTDYVRTSGADAKDKKYYYLIDDFSSRLARDILGLAVFYIKEYCDPKYFEYALNSEFREWCVLAANMLSKVKQLKGVYDDYVNKNLVFKDEFGLFMFMAMCVQKLLLADKDTKKCYSKFINAATNLRALLTGKETQTNYGTFSYDSSQKSRIFDGLYKELLEAATHAVKSVYDYMHIKALVFTHTELMQIATTGVFNGQKLDEATYNSIIEKMGIGSAAVPYESLPPYSKNDNGESSSSYSGISNMNLNSSNLINYLMEINAGGETGYDVTDPKNYEKIYYNPIWLAGESNITLGRGGFYSTNAAEIFRRMAKADSPLSAAEKQIALDYYDKVLHKRLRYDEVPAMKAFLMSSPATMQSAKDVEDAMSYEFVRDIYLRNALNGAIAGGAQDPRSVIMGAEFAGIAPGKVKNFYVGLSGNVSTELDEVRRNMLSTVSGFSNAGLYYKGWSNRINGDYAMVTSRKGYNTYLQRNYPLPNEIINMIPEGAQGFTDFVGSGPDNRAVNIHDAMMNTPTSDIYTSDDVYMGDANHPMNVKMDTTPTTSRLDVIIELLSEILKGDSSLPPATSKSTQSVAGYGEGTSNTSKSPIIIANHPAKADKANTNLKSDRLRGLYDKISKRALTYTH